MIKHRFLTVKEVAQILQLNVLTVYVYIRNNLLEAFKFGRYYRVDEKDLEQFIQIHKTKKL